MKAQTIEWTNPDHSPGITRYNAVAALNTIMQLAARGFLALVPALAIVVAAAWLVAAPDLVVYLQATLWASGFVFLGLAIDTEAPANGLSLLTAIALPVLTWLSAQLAVELAVAAATLVAVWLAITIWRHQPAHSAK